MIRKIKILLLNKVKTIFVLFILAILIMVFEMIGIGLIPIYTVLIVNPEMLFNKIPYDSNILFLENLAQKDIVLYGAVILFLAFLIKNIFLGLLIYIEAKLMQTVKEKSSKRLFNFYIHSSYMFYTNSSPENFTRLLRHDLNLAYRYMQTTLLFIRESILIIVILIFLLTINFLVYSITFLMFTAFTSIFYLTYKKSLVGKGQALQDEHKKNFKLVNQTFSSIKEIKIYQKENFFSNIFFKNIEALEKLAFFISLVSKFPRLFLEILAVFIVSSFSFVVYFYGDKQDLVPLIALMAAACIRFIPAFTAISSSLHAIKLYSTSFKSIAHELELSNKDLNLREIKSINGKIELSKFENKIELKDLTFSYPLSKKKALENVNILIEKNDQVAIIGESGAGKTTLINLILGFLSPDSGSIEVDSKNIQQNITGWQSKLGYVPQDVYLMDESIKKNIVFGIQENEVNEKLLENVIKNSRLEKFINSLPDGLNTHAGYVGAKISGGQKQRIGIARALYTQPEILILDEATNSLDVENESKILDTFLEGKITKTLIVISHRHNNLHKFNKVYKVENGKVYKVNEKK